MLDNYFNNTKLRFVRVTHDTYDNDQIHKSCASCIFFFFVANSIAWGLTPVQQVRDKFHRAFDTAKDAVELCLDGLTN